MFIAAKSINQAELFRTALLLVADGNQVPTEIEEYFSLVLKQAKSLLLKPESLNQDIVPDAINLALEFKRNVELSDKFNHINKLQSLSKIQASTILKEMEYVSVC